MTDKPTTREELRAQYKELRYCASGFIMHDCFPVKNVPEMAGLLRRIHELCTPQMVLCLLDDVGVAITKITDGTITLTAKKERATTKAKALGAPYERKSK